MIVWLWYLTAVLAAQQNICIHEFGRPSFPERLTISVMLQMQAIVALGASCWWSRVYLPRWGNWILVCCAKGSSINQFYHCTTPSALLLVLSGLPEEAHSSAWVQRMWIKATVEKHCEWGYIRSFVGYGVWKRERDRFFCSCSILVCVWGDTHLMRICLICARVYMWLYVYVFACLLAENGTRWSFHQFITACLFVTMWDYTLAVASTGFRAGGDDWGVTAVQWTEASFQH